MRQITQAEFARIVEGIRDDRASIIKHNPIGTDEEILVWMLLACLTSYLDLTEQETPCLTGVPDADTYREAIRFVVRDRMTEPFDVEGYFGKLC